MPDSWPSVALWIKNFAMPAGFKAVYSIVRDKNAAEDIVHDRIAYFAQLATNVKGRGYWVVLLSGERVPTNSLFVTACRKRALNWVRDARRRRTREGAHPGPASLSEPMSDLLAHMAHGKDHLLVGQVGEALRACVEELPDRYRHAVVMRYVNEVSRPDIAISLDTTVSAVQALLHRSLARLRSCLMSKGLDARVGLSAGGGA